MEFILPTRLGWVERKEPDRFLRVASGVYCHLLIRNPDTGERSLSSEHDRPVALRRLSAVVFPSHVKVEGWICDSPRLRDEVLLEVLGASEIVTMNIDQQLQCLDCGRVDNSAVGFSKWRKRSGDLENTVLLINIPQVGA